MEAAGTPCSGRSQEQQMEEIIVAGREKMRDPKIQERLLAEFVGTFFLVLTVGTAAVSAQSTLAAVAIGLILAVQVYIFGAVSGGLLNPAVTLGVMLSGRGKLQPLHGLMYMAAQTAAGVAAGLSAFAGTETTFCFDYKVLGRRWGTSLEYEVLFSAALSLMVLTAGTSNDAPNQYFGFAIGCTVIAGALACGGFDQGSFNPAVTVGVNVANYANADAPLTPSVGAWLVFVFGPMLGGALAAIIFRLTRGNEFEDYEQEKEKLTAKESAV